MNTPTFKEQFDKITKAYFENRLKPSFPCACFVGNLLNGTSDWAWAKYSYRANPFDSGAIISVATESGGLYSLEDILLLETNFMNVVYKDGRVYSEDAIFKAMDSTLDMLRKIHESKGEIIEGFEFSKRQLV